MPQRKLASVLPEPVGAQMSVLFPLEIAFQPPAWAGVGPSKEASNQRRTGALKGSSASAGDDLGDFALCFRWVANPLILRTRAGRPGSSRAGAPGPPRGTAQPLDQAGFRRSAELGAARPSAAARGVAPAAHHHEPDRERRHQQDPEEDRSEGGGAAVV